MKTKAAGVLLIAWTMVHSAPDRPAIRFERMPGIGFVLENHPTGEKYEAETMTGGLAVFDYNNDGRPDLFFANGAELPAFRKGGPRYYNRLYRNDGNWKFADVTAQAGLAGAGFAFGATAADFDNDGNIDLFVSALPAPQLFRNRGDGTFEDVTAQAGIRTGPWTVAAGWFDYDNDGLADLFVVNYMDWSPTNNPWCGDKIHDLRVYCHPDKFRPTANQLFRNRGDGTFEDVSVRSGIARHAGKGMSVAFGDYDGDGRADIFVTNDVLPGFLFHNKGDGTFEEAGFAAGVALPERGRAISGMGTDFRDFDNDGNPDIVLAALAGETFPLFRNIGKGAFEEVTSVTRLASISARLSGWAPLFADFDNDGWKDLFIANAHVNDRIADTSGDRYRLPNAVLRNIGGRTFENVTEGGMKNDTHAHRGAAAVDLDGDGRLDLVVTALSGPAELWRNVTQGAGHWVAIEPASTKRTQLGTVVRVVGQTNHFSSTAGYSSSNLSPLHFGIGRQDRMESVEIVWPGAKPERVRLSGIDQKISLHR